MKKGFAQFATILIVLGVGFILFFIYSRQASPSKTPKNIANSPCPSPIQENINESNQKDFKIATTPASPFIIASLSISNAPKVGETAVVKAKITSHISGKEFESDDPSSLSTHIMAKVEVPVGFEIVKGNAVWKGPAFKDIKEGELGSFLIEIKANSAGNYIIELKVMEENDENAAWNVDRLYLTIGTNCSTVSDTMPAPPNNQKGTQISTDSSKLRQSPDPNFKLPKP